MIKKKLIFNASFPPIPTERLFVGAELNEFGKYLCFDSLQLFSIRGAVITDLGASKELRIYLSRGPISSFKTSLNCYHDSSFLYDGREPATVVKESP